MNSQQLERPKRYYGRVEFLACKDEIFELEVRGYTLRAIYDFLFEKGRLTMKYRSFCGIVKKYKETGKAGATKLQQNSMLSGDSSTTGQKSNMLMSQLFCKDFAKILATK